MKLISRTKKKEIERFIKSKYHKSLLFVKGFIKEREIPLKTWALTRYIIEVAFTGYLIHYALTHFNFISLGITSALATYYINWFINTVKKKEES